MSHPKAPLPVKPVLSMILTREDLCQPVAVHLQDYFGALDLVGPWRPFTATDYYAREMGSPLKRRLVAFLHLADPAGLPDWKGLTNEIEQKFSLGGRRLINLDPGYVTRERLVLATGKNYTHRLYLNQGIYGDLTLVFAQGNFQPLSWSYPDYAHGELPALLALVRKKYLWQLKVMTE